MDSLRIVLAALLVLGISAAAMAEEHPARAELLADVAAIKPGEPFHVGIKLTMQPGWHVYWTNPGDSGQPPAVNWTLPDGFNVSDLRFPVPHRFEEPGGLIAFGYEGSVLLIAQVHPPTGLKAGAPVRIEADVSWLVCEKVCLPGDAKLAMELPVAESAAPANRPLFEQWFAQIPTSARQAGAQVKTSHDASNKRLRFEIDWPAPTKAADWFPPLSDAVTFSDIQVRSSGTKTRIDCSYALLAKKTLPVEKLQSVLAYDAGTGVRRGITIPVDFQSRNNDIRSPSD